MRVSRKRKSLLRLTIVPALITAIIVAVLYGTLTLLNYDLFSSSSSVLLFASFGSSAFLLFMIPHSRAANIGRFAKSYIIAIVLGPIGYVLAALAGLPLATGIMMFIMSTLLYTTHSEHPPAIGAMLAFILYRIDVYGIFIVLFGIVLFVSFHKVFEKYIYQIGIEIESRERFHD
jgi:CBS-domain-containing membrane protein